MQFKTIDFDIRGTEIMIFKLYDTIFVVNHGDFRGLWEFQPSLRPSLSTHFSTLRVLFVFQRIGCFLQTSSTVLLYSVFK